MANAHAEFVSIKGSRLGFLKRGNLGYRKKSDNTTVRLGSPSVDAVITVGAEITDARAISIQLKDPNGANIDFVEVLDIILFTTAAMVAYVVTGGSTGIAIGANGAIQATVAKKRWSALTDATGLLTLTYTDTGTEACFLGVRLPTGRVVMSAALTNA